MNLLKISITLSPIFSKIFLPGIRLGYIISPESFRESIQNSKINTDIATSTLMQRALEMYIKEGYSSKDAIKLVAKERGLSKNEVYQEYHRGDVE